MPKDAQGNDIEEPPTPPQEPTALEKKNRELIGELRTLKAKLGGYEGIDAEQARTALQAMEKIEEEKARAAGAFDTLKTTLVSKHQEEIAREQKRAEKLKGKLYNVLARDNISRVLADETDTPELLIPHIERFVQVVAIGDEADPTDFDVVVIGKDGKPRVKNGSGDAFTIADLVAEMREQPTFQPAFRAKVGSGSGAPRGNNGAGSGRVSAVRISNADAKDSMKYRAARAEADRLKVPLQIID